MRCIHLSIMIDSEYSTKHFRAFKVNLVSSVGKINQQTVNMHAWKAKLLFAETHAASIEITRINYKV